MAKPSDPQAFLQPDLSQPLFGQSSRYFGRAVLQHDDAQRGPLPYLERRFIPHPGRLQTIGSYRSAAPDRRDLAAASALGRADLWWQLCDAEAATDPDKVVDRAGAQVRLAIDPEGAN